MDKRHSRKRKDVFLLILFVALALLLIWVVSAEGPKDSYYAYVFGYGNTITMVNREVAEIYGVKSPGVHLMNKEGELVAPVQGGLKMAFKGLFGGDGRELKAGVQGIRVGIKLNPVGLTVSIILPLVLICLIVYRFIRSKTPVSNGQ
ncbi:MAG: hypothetical protein L0229_25685 [Blastocatellia bacterium]|nr:hypothetical protein [Blastocatellia bacterium]